MKAIKDQKIDVILYTSKLGYLEPEIHRLFEKDYLQLSSSIFVRAYSLSEELPCKEIYKNLLERFPRNKELNIPLYVWGRELYSEEFFEIDLNLEKICQRQFSQEMHYHFMSSRIGRVPAVDLRRLFNYDTAF
jgi:hypothetical protein